MKAVMRGKREGMALMLVIMVVMVAATVAAGAAVLGANSWLMTEHEERQSLLQAAADAGLEEARARVNGNKALYPDSLFTTLENNVQVNDASGQPIRNIRRSLYVGPTGVSTGQYGVFGSVVSVAQDLNGDRVVRRAEIVQESFAKFAYFTDIEGAISFGGGDALFGPVHSNDDINILASGARFYGPVTTAGVITNRGYGQYFQGYTENVARIPMPATADLNKLQTHAAAGGLAIVGDLVGAGSSATTRLQFIAIDLNGDGDTTDDDEGFMRVYQAKGTGTTRANNARWVTAHQPTSGGWRASQNCGHFNAAPGAGTLPHLGAGNFTSAANHSDASNNTGRTDDWDEALSSATRRCFLGGSDEIWDGVFDNDDTWGQYLPWAGTVDARLNTLRPLDKNYLWPLSRALNANFRGVIHVTGKVAISGTLRSRITLAATDDIIIADDVRYSVDPGAGSCTDILGLFSGTDIVIADNGLNAPQQRTPTGSVTSGGAWNYYTWDETKDEFLHGVALALNTFTAENYASGSNSQEDCETTNWGRGCLYLTGGIIQRTRGGVGTGAGTGYLKRYSYDSCAFSNPPPYFPTTGRFAKTRLFEVDPTGFNITQYYDLLTPDR